MLSSKNISKYLLYSMGEILLVVLGILIALQINNRNETRKEKKLEIKVLKEMRSNLMSDLEDLRYNIGEDSMTLNSNRIILSFMENQWPYHDSISVHFGSLPKNSTLVENVSAYENLKTFGFGLISNDSLRSSITDLYAERYPYIDEINLRTSNRFLWDNFNPILLRNLKSTKVLEDATPLNYEKLTENTTFAESLRWHIEIKTLVISLYRDTINKIHNLIKMIDHEVGEVTE